MNGRRGSLTACPACGKCLVCHPHSHYRRRAAGAGLVLLALAVLGALMACSNPQSMGHAHCILCGDCLVCDPYPAHSR